MKKIVIIDGQGGKIGSQIISAIKERNTSAFLLAIGTNSIATQNMLRYSPDAAATGENPVIVACRDADIIIGPVGIVIADSLFGEVTPAMAAAVGSSRAERILIPVNKCDTTVAGVTASIGDLISEAVEIIVSKL